MMLGAPAPFFSMVPHQLCSCYYIDAVVRVEESGAPLAHVCWMKKAYPTPHCRRSILKTTCYCWYFLSDCTYCYFSGCRFLQIASCRFCRFLQKDDGRWHFATQRKWLLRFFQASNFKVLQFTLFTFFFVLFLFRYARIFSAISESIEHDYRHTIKSPEGTISILMLRVYESCWHL